MPFTNNCSLVESRYSLFNSQVIVRYDFAYMHVTHRHKRKDGDQTATARRSNLQEKLFGRRRRWRGAEEMV